MSLISTYDLRLWMGIEEGDNGPNARLGSLSLAIQDFVDSYTNRKLEAHRYLTDPQFSYYDGTAKRYIYTKQSPVSYVSSVNIDGNRDFTSSTLMSTSDFFWEPSGKIISDAGYFSRGRRNILIDYTAGYAPVVGGTHDSTVSTYPIPLDLKQTMVEMCVESFKEGMTAVHSVQGEQPRFIQMLEGKSFWKHTLIKYKAYEASLLGGWE